MANIFEYATKELSQDAFLMWLVNSYSDKDEKLKNFSKKFLLNLIGLKEDSTVSNVKTKAQRKDLENVDVFIECKINNEITAIALEDKINTSQHDNQLVRIANKMSKNFNNYYLIYYKTGFVTKKEKRDLETINKKLKEQNINQEWKIFDVNSIKEFFDKYYYWIDNLLIASYYQYINNLAKSYKILDNDVIDESLIEWGTKKARWSALFDEFDTELPNDSGVHYYVSYWCKFVRIKDDNRFFSIELRSCSLKKKKVSFHLVMYSMPDEYQTKENLDYFEALCAGNDRIKIKNGTKKQVGLVECDNIETINDYKRAVKEVVCICEEIYKNFDAEKLNTKLKK